MDFFSTNVHSDKEMVIHKTILCKKQWINLS